MYGGIQIKQRYSLEFKMQIKQQIGIYLNESNKKTLQNTTRDAVL